MDTPTNKAHVFFGQETAGKRQGKWKLPKLPPKRVLIIAGGAAVLVIAAVLTFALTRPKSQAAVAVATVEITETGFDPAVIKVKKGERVLWVNKDTALHQVAADPHPTSESLPSLKSEDALLQDELYSAVFEKAGTFTYHDYLDPVGMQGTVIVE